MESARTSNINLLEIGICDGRFPLASPKMWKQYFKNANLICMDNFWGNVAAYEHHKNTMDELGIKLVFADQGSEADWNKFKTETSYKFDFIVEDGSHEPTHMMYTLWQSIDILKPGGIIFLEDIQHPSIEHIGFGSYKNSKLYTEFLHFKETGTLNTEYLPNNQMALEIAESFELLELVVDPMQYQILAVFKRK
ncbi:MAG: hypothetical protein EBU90_27795 [Proteobacteria bacterium]|nr:hypothetical protein [Pseudomonadota bacterium]